MMSIRVVRDSTSPRGVRLTTLLLPPAPEAACEILAHHELSVTTGPLGIVLTGTDAGCERFFWRRCREEQPGPIRGIARACYLARRESIPGKLEWGEWHTPFVDDAPQWFPRNAGEAPPHAIPESAAATLAACGLDADPSATEHQCCPMLDATASWLPEWRGNLDGWLQFRPLCAKRMPSFRPSEEELASWTDLTVGEGAQA